MSRMAGESESIPLVSLRPAGGIGQPAGNHRQANNQVPGDGDRDGDDADLADGVDQPAGNHQQAEKQDQRTDAFDSVEPNYVLAQVAVVNEQDGLGNAGIPSDHEVNDHAQQERVEAQQAADNEQALDWFERGTEDELMDFFKFKEPNQRDRDDEAWNKRQKDLINQKNRNGKTPLQIVLEKGFLKALHEMLKHLLPADVQRPPQTYAHLLHQAVDFGNIDIIRRLVELRFPKNNQDEQDQTPLHLAVRAKNPTIIVAILMTDDLPLNGRVRRDSLSHEQNVASFSDSARVVAQQVIQTSDVNITGRNPVENKKLLEHRDIHGFTPLLRAAELGFWEAAKELLRAADDAKMEMLKLLETKTNNQQNLLHFALERKQANFLENLLIYFERREEVYSFWRQEPRTIHSMAKYGSREGTEILIKAKVRLQTPASGDRSPLHLAAKGGHRDVLDWLVCDQMFTTIIDSPDRNSNTALHLAAEKGHARICDDLMKKGAKLTQTNADNRTPIELAILGAHLECVKVLCKDINQKFRSGLFPLHLAAQQGQESIVAALLLKKPNFELEGPRNRNALEIALDCNKINVAKRLLMDTDENWKIFLRRRAAVSFDTSATLKTPMRRLIADFPDLARQVMAQCIIRNQNQEIQQCDFEFIDDTFVMKQSEDEQKISPENPTWADLFESRSACNPENDQVHNSALPYNPNRRKIYLQHPLKIMATSENSETKRLLDHDLITRFIETRKKEFGSNASDLILFCVFLFSYSFILILSDRWHQEKNSALVEATEFGDYELKIFENKNSSAEQCAFDYPLLDCLCIYSWNRIVSRILLGLSIMASLFTSIVLLLKEISQWIQLKCDYWKSFENLLQMTILVLSIFTSLWKGIDEAIIWRHAEWPFSTSECQLFWICSALAIGFAWCNLLLLLGKEKKIGLFVLMFKNVALAFSKAWVFIFFLAAFSFSFFLLLQDKDDFSRIHYSFFKTLVMGTGEMDFSDLFHGNNEKKEKPWLGSVAYILYVVFILVIVLLVMNLLTGLAVDEIKDIQNDAEYEKLAIEIDTLLLELRFADDAKLRSLSYKDPPTSPPPAQTNSQQSTTTPSQQQEKKLPPPPSLEEILLGNQRIIEQLQSDLKYVVGKLKGQEVQLNNEQEATQKLLHLVRECKYNEECNRSQIDRLMLAHDDPKEFKKLREAERSAIQINKQEQEEAQKAQREKEEEQRRAADQKAIEKYNENELAPPSI